MIACALGLDGQPVKLSKRKYIELSKQLEGRQQEIESCAEKGHIKGQQVRQEQKWLCANCGVVIFG